MAGEFRKLLAILRELAAPSLACTVPALAELFLEAIVDAVGNQKLRVLGPSVIALRQPDLFFSQRLAVRRAGVLFMRRAIRDVAVDDDQRRPVFSP